MPSFYALSLCPLSTPSISLCPLSMPSFYALSLRHLSLSHTLRIHFFFYLMALSMSVYNSLFLSLGIFLSFISGSSSSDVSPSLLSIQSFFLSVYLSLSVCLSVFLSLCLSLSQSISLCLFLSLYL